jgi:ankyrin repeat protein
VVRLHAIKARHGLVEACCPRVRWQKYATSVEFAAAAAPKPAPAPEPVAAPAPKPAPKPVEKAAPATTSNIDKKSATALLVQAMMDKDEHRALEIIKLGADPNGRDQYGVPVLNWAIMVCQPQVVKALVDKKADLTYQRAPGMTVMVEAGACPEAAKILKAAGAK